MLFIGNKQGSVLPHPKKKFKSAKFKKTLRYPNKGPNGVGFGTGFPHCIQFQVLFSLEHSPHNSLSFLTAILSLSACTCDWPFGCVSGALF